MCRWGAGGPERPSHLESITVSRLSSGAGTTSLIAAAPLVLGQGFASRVHRSGAPGDNCARIDKAKKMWGKNLLVKSKRKKGKKRSPRTYFHRAVSRCLEGLEL